VTEFIVEITPWISLRHTNVLRLLAMCPEPASLCIVTDLIPRGSLWDVLHKVRLPARRMVPHGAEHHSDPLTRASAARHNAAWRAARNTL
jgi:hypothetical protein